MCRKITYIILLAIAVTSCSAPHYLTPLTPSAMHTQASQGVIMLGTGTSGFDAFASYSLNDKLSLQSSVMIFEQNGKDYSYYDIGASLFQYKEPPFQMSFSAGPGLGYSNNDLSDTNFTVKPYASYFKFWGQPSIGIANEFFDTYLNMRMSYLNFYDLYVSGELRSHQMVMFEPTLGFQGGYKFVKFFMQFGITLPASDIGDVSFEPIHMHLGMYVSFPVKK